MKRKNKRKKLNEFDEYWEEVQKLTQKIKLLNEYLDGMSLQLNTLKDEFSTMSSRQSTLEHNMKIAEFWQLIKKANLELEGNDIVEDFKRIRKS